MKYYDFQDGLCAALNKIKEYYERTADSDAYIMAICKFCLLEWDYYDSSYL